MVVGRSRSKLTATEREAMARLRERRATGELPAALSHAVPHTPCELPTFSTISGRPPKRGPAPRHKRFRFRRRRRRHKLQLGETQKVKMCGLPSVLSNVASCFGNETKQRNSVSTVGANKNLKSQMTDCLENLKSLVKGTRGVDDDCGVSNGTQEKCVEKKKSRFANLVKSLRTAPMVNFEMKGENEGGIVGYGETGDENAGQSSDDAYYRSLLAGC